MTDRGKAKQFNQFINELRLKRNIPMERLCEGLCSSRTAWYLEKGERAPDKLLQDCILDRLGIGAEDYEYFLYYDEYARWEARQHILHNITYENWIRAEQLLQEYAGTHNMENRLEKQFYLSMLAQILRHKGEAPASLYNLFQAAVQLTVPEFESKPFDQLTLSIKELNLLLETESCRKENARPQQYQAIADYILTNSFDGISITKLYPKAIYYLCRSVIENTEADYSEQWPDHKLLAYCNQALTFLRNYLRMYYLWEILDMRETLLKRMTEALTRQQETLKAANLVPLRQENASWMQALEKTYEEFHIPKETFEYCYLYVVKGVACINDVIRIRRKMFGMSRAELCEGICDIATLRRLERRETATHREITEKLFDRLGLSTEFAKTNLITSCHEARLLMGKLKREINAEQWEKADVLHRQIKNLINMDIPQNRQTLTRQELLSRWNKGELDTNEYLACMRTTLELTLPGQALYGEGEKYLTNAEQFCISNMLTAMNEANNEYMSYAYMFEDLYHSYEANELLETVFSMYEVIMGNIGSWHGNRDEFDLSDKYNNIILLGCLRFRRSSMVNRTIYGRWWNYDMRKRQGIPTDRALDDREELTRSILFSQLNNEKHRIQFLQDKLDSIKMEE